MKTTLSNLISRLIMLMAAAVLLGFNLSVARAQMPGELDGTVAPATESAVKNSTPTLNSPVSSCITPPGTLECQFYESDAAGNPSEISNVITLPRHVHKGYVVLLENPGSDPNDQSQWSDVLVFGTNGIVLPATPTTDQAQLLSDGCASGVEGDTSCFPSVAIVNASNHIYIVEVQTGTGNDDTDVTTYIAGPGQTSGGPIATYNIHSGSPAGETGGGGAFGVNDVFQINYFAGANGARPDQTVRITNPGSVTGRLTPTGGTSNGNLCANIYVFRKDQQMTECCSCFVSPNGLRTLSVDFDLTNNALTVGAIGEGMIKIISSDGAGSINFTTGVCSSVSGATSFAATSYVPFGALRAWGTHNQDVSGGLQGSAINQVTETHFLDATLSRAELGELQTNCRFINEQGSGAGKCTCGRGD